jgi:hypothetical protein
VLPSPSWAKHVDSGIGFIIRASCNEDDHGIQGEGVKEGTQYEPMGRKNKKRSLEGEQAIFNFYSLTDLLHLVFCFKMPIYFHETNLNFPN